MSKSAAQLLYGPVLVFALILINVLISPPWTPAKLRYGAELILVSSEVSNRGTDKRLDSGILSRMFALAALLLFLLPGLLCSPWSGKAVGLKSRERQAN